MHTLLRRLLAWMRRDTLDAQLAEEIRQHLAARTHALVERGVPPDEAERQARRMFGSVRRVREESRDLWGFPSLEAVLQDLRFGVRLLRRSPVFTTVAVASLAIALSASLAVFSLAEALLFGVLPVRDPGRLVLLRWISGPVLPFDSLSGTGSQGEMENSSTSFSLSAFEAAQEGVRAQADVVGFAQLYRVNLGIDGQPDLGTGLAVSGNYFAVLGVAPAAGRPLASPDDRRSAEPAAMISHALWRRRFAATPDVVGRRISINGVPVTVVGVTPRGFAGTLQVGDAPDVFVPLSLAPRLERSEEHYNPNFWWVLMMARLKPDVAAADLAPTLDALVKQNVAANRPALGVADLPRVSVEPGAHGQSERRSTLREPLLIMAGVVAIVLLVACANIANLLLARANARAREMAMRMAIGAPRTRIVRQLLTESLLLAAIGCALGLLLANWVGQTLIPALDVHDELRGLEAPVRFNWTLAAFTLAAAAAVSLLAGILPALRAVRTDVMTNMQEGGRGHLAGGSRFGVAGTLIVGQVALCLVLIAAAGLLVGSVRNLERVDPGFDTSNLLVFRIDPTLNGYEGERLRSLHASILERLRALPGVVGASMSSHTLLSGSAAISEVHSSGTAGPSSTSPGEGRRRPLAWRLNVDDEFFGTMRLPLYSGRGFGPGDAATSQPVAVVNRAFVRMVFPDGEGIGRRFKLSGRPGAPEFEVVGIAADARFSSIRSEVPPTVYLSTRQASPGPMSFALRTAADPLALIDSARAAVASIEPDVPPFDIRTQAAQAQHSLKRERQFAAMATLLGGVTLALCAIGVYGLFISQVSRRIPEIGIRMAIGADARRVRWMIMSQSFRLVLTGVVLGVAAALAATQALESLLFGLGERDPLVLAGAAVLLVAVAALAAYLPARRASRIDPVRALRV